jgi:SAM-dependent methyltransferase
MKLIEKKSCRACGSTELKKVLSLGYQYLQGYFLDNKSKNKKNNFYKKKFLTELIFCNIEKNINGCGLLQLSITVPPKLLYSKYFYKSGVNKTMTKHLYSIAQEIINFSKKKINVLDIGCNDGTLLNFYPKHFYKFGIDPSNILSNINKDFNFINDFFPSNRLEKILKKKKLDVITSIAMFYDLESPNIFVKNIYKLLKKYGVWIFEMSYMPQMLKLNSYDTICHEHLEYYSLSVIKKILEKNNMKIARIKLNNSNGGSIRCYAVKKDNFKFGTVVDKKKISNLLKKEISDGLETVKPYKIFKKKIIQHKKKLKNLITKLKKQGKKIHIYGASTK